MGNPLSLLTTSFFQTMSSPKKRGEGTSCHHCKKRIPPNEMLKCTRGEIVPTNSRKRKVLLIPFKNNKFILFFLASLCKEVLSALH